MDRNHHNDQQRMSGRGVPAGMGMDPLMMWVLIACCLAIPVLLILGVLTGAGLIGASGWIFVVVGVVAAAVMIVIARSRTAGSGRRSP